MIITTPTIIFFIALVGIVGMIIGKNRQIKKQKRSALSNFFGKADHFFASAYATIRYLIALVNKANAIALIQWIAYHILSWVHGIYKLVHRKAHAHPHSKKVIDMVKGRGEVGRGDGASFYLKRISEDEYSQPTDANKKN